MVFEICVVIVTIIFIILAFFIVQTLRTVQKSLRNLDLSMDQLEIKVDELQTTINEVLINANETIEKFNDKLEVATPVVELFARMGEVGTGAVNFCESKMDDYYAKEKKKSAKWEDKLSGAFEIINLGFDVFKKIKQRK